MLRSGPSPRYFSGPSAPGWPWAASPVPEGAWDGQGVPLPSSQLSKWVNSEELKESGAVPWSLKPCFPPVTAGC